MLNDEKLLIIGYSIISSFFVARGGIEDEVRKRNSADTL
ncbi:Gamma-glutamylcyclotransferase [Priestia megaterium]|jgi:hypothetical protein|uniref:Uncharacterized protein n=1 Tax=Priestia megaterium (strain ATCC 12872 / QMB1551) TaxID=545693 RepID=D5DVY2_PRIM1|nr:hypothetical protein BMQ_2924 [Priestia megaterium QM B1551]